VIILDKRFIILIIGLMIIFSVSTVESFETKFILDWFSNLGSLIQEGGKDVISLSPSPLTGNSIKDITGFATLGESCTTDGAISGNLQCVCITHPGHCHYDKVSDQMICGEATTFCTWRCKEGTNNCDGKTDNGCECSGTCVEGKCCGNGVCETGETCSNCVADCGCGIGKYCDNGVCKESNSNPPSNIIICNANNVGATCTRDGKTGTCVASNDDVDGHNVLNKVVYYCDTSILPGTSSYNCELYGDVDVSVLNDGDLDVDSYRVEPRNDKTSIDSETNPYFIQTVSGVIRPCLTKKGLAWNDEIEEGVIDPYGGSGHTGAVKKDYCKNNKDIVKYYIDGKWGSTSDNVDQFVGYNLDCTSGINSNGNTVTVNYICSNGMCQGCSLDSQCSVYDNYDSGTLLEYYCTSSGHCCPKGTVWDNDKQQCEESNRCSDDYNNGNGGTGGWVFRNENGFNGHTKDWAACYNINTGGWSDDLQKCLRNLDSSNNYGGWDSTLRPFKNVCVYTTGSSNCEGRTECGYVDRVILY